MKHVLLVCVFLCCASICICQSKNPKTDTLKTITTTIDTLIVTNNPYECYELRISNRSTSDTLMWRTNMEAVWRKIIPNSTGTAEAYCNRIIFKVIYRKAKQGSGIKSELWAN
jgi:hypothetical protein